MSIATRGVHTRLYEFAPGVRLRITGDRAVARYFDGEYGSARAEGAEASVDVVFGAAVEDERARVRGAYRTVGWTISLGDGGADMLRAGIALHGRPRTFALSLVQGYVVEQLVATAAARTGLVLLPAAGLLDAGGVLLVLGRSRSGKSSLTARALARGMRMLGDDQVLVDSAGRCLPFPRRLRAYADLARTAPAAYRLLAPSARAALAARRAVHAITRGRVAPPLHISPSALGQGSPPPATAIARVALVERVAAAGRLQVDDVDVDEVVAFARTLLEQQRVQLRPTERSWREAAKRATRVQEEVLRAALHDVAAVRISLPDAWPAERAVAALARAVGADD